MHGEQMGTVAIIAIIMVILFAIVYDPSSIYYVISAICMLLYMASLKKPVPEEKPVVIAEPPITKVKPSSTNEKEPDTNDDALINISESNRYALDQLYGRKCNNMDSKMTEHKKRIGDRDRKATIAQIKGRRQNVYEPYYRQELEEHSNKRWWEPDTAIIMNADKNHMRTVQMGEHSMT